MNKNLEYKIVSAFKDWASWTFQGEGVYGVAQSPDGTRGVIVRNPLCFVQVYVLRKDLEPRQEREALSLIARRNRVYDILGQPSEEEFNKKRYVKSLNTQLKKYLLNCYTDKLQTN